MNKCSYAIYILAKHISLLLTNIYMYSKTIIYIYDHQQNYLNYSVTLQQNTEQQSITQLINVCILLFQKVIDKSWN